jgi:hypothetical protein
MIPLEEQASNISLSLIPILTCVRYQQELTQEFNNANAEALLCSPHGHIDPAAIAAA